MGMFRCGDPPLVRPLPEGDKWKLEEPFWFIWTDGEKVVKRIVPIGFVTDGLSIPRFYRGRFSPNGKAFRAAIAHDYLYRECPFREPRALCDQVLNDGAQFCGEGWWNRNMLHKAVRIGGWVPYGRKCE